MDNVLDIFMAKEEPNQSCFLVLRSIILESHPDMQETLKYGMPCYTFKGKHLFYLWEDKKTGWPYILFVDGQLMDHPKLSQGKRARMKIYYQDPTIDLDLDEIKDLLNSALELRLSSD